MIIFAVLCSDCVGVPVAPKIWMSLQMICSFLKTSSVYSLIAFDRFATLPQEFILHRVCEVENLQVRFCFNLTVNHPYPAFCFRHIGVCSHVMHIKGTQVITLVIGLIIWYVILHTLTILRYISENVCIHCVCLCVCLWMYLVGAYWHEYTYRCSVLHAWFFVNRARMATHTWRLSLFSCHYELMLQCNSQWFCCSYKSWL